MFLCVCICVGVCVYVSVFFVCVHVYVRDLYVHVHSYVDAYIRDNMCVCVCVYVCFHEYIYVHTCIYTFLSRVILNALIVFVKFCSFEHENRHSEPDWCTAVGCCH